MMRSQWQNAQYTDIQRESSIASADVLAKMRIGSKERSEAKRYLSVAMVREKERATRDAPDAYVAMATSRSNEIHHSSLL